MVHRALFDKNAPKVGVLKAVAEHISVTERNSADAERDSKDVKLYRVPDRATRIRRAGQISRTRD